MAKRTKNRKTGDLDQERRDALAYAKASVADFGNTITNPMHAVQSNEISVTLNVRQGRTQHERTLARNIFDRLDRVFEAYFSDRNWTFDFDCGETDDFFVFAVTAKCRDADLDHPDPTSAVILIADEANRDIVNERCEAVKAEYEPKPEIICIIDADNYQVQQWTLKDGKCSHRLFVGDGEIEFFLFGGDLFFCLIDVYEDVDFDEEPSVEVAL